MFFGFGAAVGLSAHCMSVLILYYALEVDLELHFISTVILHFISAAIDSGCLSVIDYFPGFIFVTDGRRDLGLGSYERS